MHRLRAGRFDIRHTVDSAQPLTFFGDMRNDRRGVAYTYKDTLIEVEQKGSTVAYSSYGDLSGAEIRKEVLSRFRLDDDIADIYKRIGTDLFIRRAIRKYSGMRVTKNEPWETTLCFLISQFNNVKRIRGIVRNLILAYGEERSFSTDTMVLKFRTFPKPERIARLSVKELMSHGAGFRARYIKSVAQACSESFDLDRLYRKGYEEAKEQLMEMDGIGDKVADCILLFGYGKLGAFPIDVWIKRVVERNYFRGRKKSVKEIHSFAEERWNGYAGYAQQYLYHSARNEI
ncbi:MAG: DNA glycosylase [Candidatus Micrarchaeales archaeon]|jgi:N-glycosylase/DNA lyase